MLLLSWPLTSLNNHEFLTKKAKQNLLTAEKTLQEGLADTGVVVHCFTVQWCLHIMILIRRNHYKKCLEKTPSREARGILEIGAVVQWSKNWTLWPQSQRHTWRRISIWVSCKVVDLLKCQETEAEKRLAFTTGQWKLPKRAIISAKGGVPEY